MNKNTLELEPLNKTADVNGSSQHSIDTGNSIVAIDALKQRKSHANQSREESLGSKVMRASGLAVGQIRGKSFFAENSPETPGTLTTSGAVLGIISTILGGGMVGIPWAIYSQGFVLGIGVSAFAAIQVTICSVLYLKAREVCPDKPSSMFEIGYLIMGRPSIFAICFTIWINSFFLIVIFVSVFGNTATNVVVSIMGCTGDACGIWGESYIYMLIIAVALLPTTFMKEIAELHLVSMSLFGAALLFVVINVFQIFFRDHKDYSNVDQSYSSYLWPTTGDKTQIINVINATTIVFTACNFQVNLFPIHSNQIDKTIKGTVKTIGITMFLVQSVYIILSLSVIFNYGSLINQDVLQNVGKSYPILCSKATGTQLAENPPYPAYYVTEANKNESVYPENYVMQFLFLIILACHIPYLFYSGKEALLIMIDEIMRKSISLTLSKKLLQEGNSEDIHAGPEMPEDEHTAPQSREMSQKQSFAKQGTQKQRGQSELGGDRFSETRQSLQNNLVGVSARVTQVIEAALPDDLNEVNAQEATGLAYKTMPAAIYYIVTLVLYATEVYVATIGLEIGQIFGVIATFAGNGLSFFIPSLFVIIGFRKFAEKRFLDENGKWVTIAWINFFMGVFFFILFLGNNVLGFLNTPPKLAKDPCALGNFGTN